MEGNIDNPGDGAYGKKITINSKKSVLFYGDGCGGFCVAGFLGVGVTRCLIQKTSYVNSIKSPRKSWMSRLRVILLETQSLLLFEKLFRKPFSQNLKIFHEQTTFLMFSTHCVQG